MTDNILFLDADDELMPEASSLIVSAISKVHGAVGAIGAHVEIDEHRRHDAISSEDHLKPSSGITPRPIDGECIVCDSFVSPFRILGPYHGFVTSGVTIMSSAFPSVASLRFADALVFAEDRDFLYRLAQIGPIAVVKSPIVRRFRSPGQLTQSAAKVTRWLDDQLVLCQRYAGRGQCESDELWQSTAWVLKHAARTLAKTGHELSHEQLNRVHDTFRKHGWPLPPALRRLTLRSRIRRVVFALTGRARSSPKHAEQ
jgi:hypothetical protein